MHRTEPGLCQADTRHQRGVGHLRARRGRLLAMERRQGLARGHDPGAGEGIGHRVGARRDEGLEELRKGVQAVGGDQRRWAGGEQIRIDDRPFGDQPVVAERLLEAAGRRQHGILRRLGTGTGGGRHGDERRCRAVVGQFRADALKMVHHRVAGPQQPGDGFGRIERAAAADADHASNREAAQGGDGRIDELRRRFAGDTLACSQARPRCERRSANSRAPASDSTNERSAGDEQQMTAVTGSDVRELVEGAAAEFDARQAGDRKGAKSCRSCGQESVHRLAATRLGHHAGNGRTPGEIVRGLLVRGCVGGRRVGLVENEARRVIGRLQNVEAPVARLADRRLVIDPRCGDEGIDILRLTRTCTSVTCMVASLEFTRRIVHSVVHSAERM
jgi:hypothetical protein